MRLSSGNFFIFGSGAPRSPPAWGVRRQSFGDNGLGKLREVLAIGFGDSGSLQPVAQATVGDGLSFDPFSFCQDGWPAPVVDVGGGKIVDALVVAAVVVVSTKAAIWASRSPGRK